ncbi:uncharacterized protein LOC113755439 [Coffea eugenioides]|uniref:uncharacterized protein LOC113755439 n=1 Tax=Coffea eugenioides TaxID=49369 RepID=UPI000F615229|nr:uncharacterized protein LOC113755439 [Coffea eugenioides]
MTDMTDDDDNEFHENVDDTAEWLGVDHHKTDVQNKTTEIEKDDSLVMPEDIDVAPDFESDFETVLESYEEINRSENVVFNPKDMDNPQLKLQMLFSSIKECKLAVTNYSIRQGRPCKFVKHDRLRVRAKCRSEGCHWEIYARKLADEGSVQIKTIEDTHTCGFTYDNPLVNSGWVGRKYAEEFRTNPKVNMKHFRKTVIRENKCSFSKKQTYRARNRAFKIIHDSESDQYGKLGAYMNEIQKSNPGSSIILKTVDESTSTTTQQQRFQRLYVCFNGVKQGFLNGLVGEILLIAVGFDANNSIYPVAYAIAEGENKESWAWFFKLLKEDLKIERDYELTIMSDKQKGLIQVCDLVFPNAAHRFCVKHMHANFSSAGFKGEALRKALWTAAKATTPTEFFSKMEEMAAIDIDAARWFDDKAPAQWSRAFFSTYPKCDILLNNLCECFNSKIVDAREKPIIEIMELLRLYLMQRMQ